MRKVYRQADNVVVEDENGERETFDDVIFASNANQTLMMLDKPTFLERYILSSIRYESELHNHTVVHSDSSVLPDNEVKPLTTRSTTSNSTARDRTTMRSRTSCTTSNRGPIARTSPAS